MSNEIYILRAAKMLKTCCEKTDCDKCILKDNDCAKLPAAWSLPDD